MKQELLGLPALPTGAPSPKGMDNTPCEEIHQHRKNPSKGASKGAGATAQQLGSFAALAEVPG